VEPDGWEDQSAEYQKMLTGFRPGKSIQPRRTILIDLRQSEEEILARMKQKTRYNINLAVKKEIKVRVSNDVNEFYGLMTTTGSRDGFGIHTKSYYAKAMEVFGKSSKCKLFIADFKDKPLAGIMVFASGKRAWYFYGASSNLERNRMPTYLLQWEAMRWAKSMGCETYDLWGIPDEPEEVLENQFETRVDGLWKVYRFKRGFGGQIRRTAGGWDKVFKPALYNAYQFATSKSSEAG